jgi:hypothetical protein
MVQVRGFRGSGLMAFLSEQGAHLEYMISFHMSIQWILWKSLLAPHRVICQFSFLTVAVLFSRRVTRNATIKREKTSLRHRPNKGIAEPLFRDGYCHVVVLLRV